MTRRILLSVALALHLPPALAYLDPSTGNMILQGLVGTLAAATAAIGLYWSKIKGFFTSNAKSKPTDTPKNTETGRADRSPDEDEPGP